MRWKTKRRSLPKSEAAEMSPDAITLQYRRAAPLEMDEAFSGSLSFFDAINVLERESWSSLRRMTAVFFAERLKCKREPVGLTQRCKSQPQGLYFRGLYFLPIHTREENKNKPLNITVSPNLSCVSDQRQGRTCCLCV